MPIQVYQERLLKSHATIADLELIASLPDLANGQALLTELATRCADPALLTRLGFKKAELEALTPENIKEFCRAAALVTVHKQLRAVNLNTAEGIADLQTLIEYCDEDDGENFWAVPAVQQACARLNNIKQSTINRLTGDDLPLVANEARNLVLSQWLRMASELELWQIAASSKNGAGEAFWSAKLNHADVVKMALSAKGIKKKTISSMSQQQVLDFGRFAAREFFAQRIRSNETPPRILELIALHAANSNNGAEFAVKLITAKLQESIRGVADKLTKPDLQLISKWTTAAMAYNKAVAKLYSREADVNALKNLAGLFGNPPANGNELIEAAREQLRTLAIDTDIIKGLDATQVENFLKSAADAVVLSVLKNAAHSTEAIQHLQNIALDHEPETAIAALGLPEDIFHTSPKIKSAAAREAFLRALDKPTISIKNLKDIGEDHHTDSGENFYQPYAESGLEEWFGTDNDKIEINPEIMKQLLAADIAEVCRKSTKCAAEQIFTERVQEKSLLEFASISKLDKATFIEHQLVKELLLVADSEEEEEDEEEDEEEEQEEGLTKEALQGLNQTDIAEICQKAVKIGVVGLIKAAGYNLEQTGYLIKIAASAAAGPLTIDTLKTLLTDDQWKALKIDPPDALNILNPSSIQEIIDTVSNKLLPTDVEVDKIAPKNKGTNPFRLAYKALKNDNKGRLIFVSLSEHEKSRALNIIKTSTNAQQITRALKALGFSNNIVSNSALVVARDGTKPNTVEQLAQLIINENKRVALIKRIHHRGLVKHFIETGFAYDEEHQLDDKTTVLKLVQKINSLFYQVRDGGQLIPKDPLDNIDDALNGLLLEAGMDEIDGYTTNNAAARDIHAANIPILARLIVHGPQASKNPALLEFLLTKKLDKDVLLEEEDLIPLEDAFNKIVREGSSREPFDKIVKELIETRKILPLSGVAADYTPAHFMTAEEFQRLSYNRRGIKSIEAAQQLNKELAHRGFGTDGLMLPGDKPTRKLREFLDQLGGMLPPNKPRKKDFKKLEDYQDAQTKYEYATEAYNKASEAYFKLLRNLFNPALGEIASDNARAWHLRLKHAADRAKVDIENYEGRLIEVELRLEARHYGNEKLNQHRQKLVEFRDNLKEKIKSRELALTRLKDLISSATIAATAHQTPGFRELGAWSLAKDDPSLAETRASGMTGATSERDCTITSSEDGVFIDALPAIGTNQVSKHYLDKGEAADALIKYRAGNRKCDEGVNRGIFIQNSQGNEVSLLKRAAIAEDQLALTFAMTRQILSNRKSAPSEREPLQISGKNDDDICQAIAAAKILMEDQGISFNPKRGFFGTGGSEFDSPFLVVLSMKSIQELEPGIKQYYEMLKANTGLIRYMKRNYELGVLDPKQDSKEARTEVAKNLKDAGHFKYFRESTVAGKFSPAHTLAAISPTETSKQQLKKITDETTARANNPTSSLVP